MYSKLKVLIAVLFCLLMGLSPIMAGAISNDQAANLVVGQSSFTTSNSGTTQTQTDGPTGMAFDSSGNLWVADYLNDRVLEYTAPVTTGEAASLVIGQPDFVTRGCATTATALCNPISVAFDSSGNLWVADPGNNRVLEFTSPFSTGEAASLVLGQPSFVANGGVTSAAGMARPYAVKFDSSGNLWVAESTNNRVTEFVKGGGFSTGEAASLVLGQPSFVASAPTTTATGLNFPSGLAFDSSGNLWVADLQNNRAVEFVKGGGFSTGEAASLVLGQPDFVSSTLATTATGLDEPSGVAIDSSGTLWVADSTNDRVVGFVPGGGFTNGEAASIVLGQVSFTTKVGTTTATGLGYTWAVTTDPNNLWVADYGNNRVLEFGGAAPGPAPSATLLPPTIAKHLTFNFNFPNAPTLLGNLVSTWGVGVIYNVPGYNAAVDINPYDVSICLIPAQGGIQITSYVSVSPGNNSTELFVSYWYGTITSAQGWPSEPACPS